jgi:hypothetical protein
MRKRSTRWRKPWPERAGVSILTGLFAGTLLFTSAVFAQDYDAGRKAYLDGDYTRALRILKPLATDGNSEAQKLLGVMYDYGHGVDRDPAEALRWYLKSAAQGDPAVQYQVGAKYFRGDGTGQNYQEAARWWEQAANGGQVDAQFNLGLMYFRGLSVQQDDGKAAELFGKAAAQGHAHAQYSLAVMYSTGRGVPKDYALARDLFEKSAAQGVSQAQFNLGVFYENAYGVERNLETARVWYERAAAQGLSEARGKLEQLNSAEAASPIGHPDELAAARRRDPRSTRVYDPREDGPRTAVPESAPAPAPAPAEPAASPVPAAPAAGDDLRREAWVLAQNPDSFTLQIGSVTSEQHMRRFLQDSGIENEAGYVAVVIDGVTRYNALYGAYPSYAEAQRAAENLPPALRGVKPWIRNFGILQKLLQ